MICSNCGKNLIRGYAFCLECGSPVPPEVLEEGGMPGRTDNEGRPASDGESTPKNDDKTENAGDSVSDVQSLIPGVGSFSDSNSTETLVFCPNCGMHMQSDPYRCNICGKKLIDKPKNVPLSAGGVPLMNVNLMAGMGGIGEGLDGISESDIEQISSFMSGTGNIPIFAAEEESTPDLFGSDISANDFAALSEQLAIFSAANEMPSIDAIEREPEKTPEKNPTERRVDNFSMSDDGAAVISDNSVPVIENYSMDEKPEENVNLDPYKFLDNSMEDAPEPLFSKPVNTQPQTAQPVQTVQPVQPVQPEPPAPVERPVPEKPVYEPVFAQNKPFEPPVPESSAAPKAAVKSDPQPPLPPVFPESAPVIEESAPVISETAAPPIPETPGSESDPFSRSVPPSMPQQSSDPIRNDEPHGNMFRCQFCGQSMYDTDKFCPNCGASYKKGSASPKGKSKAPLFIGIAAAVIVLAAGCFFAMKILNNGNGGESLPSNSSSPAVSDTSEPEESSQTEESTEPDSSESSESTASSTESSTSTGGAPNSSTGAPSSSTGAPPSSTGTPNGSSSPSSTGGPPSSTGAPNGSNRPSSTGGPPSSTGAPNGSSSPSSTGAPNSTSGTSSSAGAPNSSNSSSSTGAPSSSR